MSIDNLLYKPLLEEPEENYCQSNISLYNCLEKTIYKDTLRNKKLVDCTSHCQDLLYHWIDNFIAEVRKLKQVSLNNKLYEIFVLDLLIDSGTTQVPPVHLKFFPGQNISDVSNSINKMINYILSYHQPLYVIIGVLDKDNSINIPQNISLLPSIEIFNNTNWKYQKGYETQLIGKFLFDVENA